MTLVCCGTPASTDKSGEWGAYFTAFEAFSEQMKENTSFLCIDRNDVEGNNYDKLYDLFDNYCKGKKMRLLEGERVILRQKDLLTNDGELKDGYLVSFAEAVWSKNRDTLTVTVSLQNSTTVNGSNPYGTVTVTKADGKWQAQILPGGSTYKGPEGAYLAVFDYFVKNAGMSTLKDVLVVDPGGIEQEARQKVYEGLKRMAAQQGYTYRKAGWEQLANDGLISESGEFLTGYHLRYSDVEWQASDLAVMTCQITQGFGGTFTVLWDTDRWAVTNVRS